MQNVIVPGALKKSQVSLSVLPHSIGGEGAGGDYAFKLGGGPYWQGKITVPSMGADDAYDVRGFFHSLRGANGSFLLQVPSFPIAASSVDLTLFYGLQWGGTALLWGGEVLTWGLPEIAIPDPDVMPGSIPPGFAAQTVLTDDVRANAICAKIDAVINPGVVGAIGPGVRLWIGNDLDSGQLVDVVAADGAQIEFRPQLRRAYSANTFVCVGSVYARFRLVGDVPYVPVNGQHSLPFEVSFCEYY